MTPVLRDHVQMTQAVPTVQEGAELTAVDGQQLASVLALLATRDMEAISQVDPYYLRVGHTYTYK